MACCVEVQVAGAALMINRLGHCCLYGEGLNAKTENAKLWLGGAPDVKFLRYLWSRLTRPKLQSRGGVLIQRERRNGIVEYGCTFVIRKTLDAATYPWYSLTSSIRSRVD